MILGFTFKENCPDVRNTKVIDIYKTLKEYNLDITVYDPWTSPGIIENEYGIKVVQELPHEKYDTIILAVCHSVFEDLNIDSMRKEKSVFYDVKGMMDINMIDGRL